MGLLILKVKLQTAECSVVVSKSHIEETRFFFVGGGVGGGGGGSPTLLPEAGNIVSLPLLVPSTRVSIIELPPALFLYSAGPLFWRGNRPEIARFYRAISPVYDPNAINPFTCGHWEVIYFIL